MLKDKDFKYDEEIEVWKYKNEIITFNTIVGNNQDHQLLDLSTSLKTKLKIAGIIMNIKVVDKKEF
jgi:hypothetical protein